MQVIRPHKV